MLMMPYFKRSAGENRFFADHLNDTNVTTGLFLGWSFYIKPLEDLIGF
jgi:hypothetical protein